MTDTRRLMKKKQKILLIILAVIIAAAAVISITINHYLNKINYDDGTAQTAETATEEQNDNDQENDIDDAEIPSEDRENSAELNEADKDINQNLGSGTVSESKNVENILLLGIDYGSSNFPYGRSDAMILLSLNKSKGVANLVSLSRAAYVNVSGFYNTRLSHAHGLGGAGLAKKTVEENYKIKINNYVSTTFSSFEKIIDVFGGVRITLTSAEASAMKNKLGSSKAGTYDLNGKNALEYVRIRSIDTDRDRTGRQRKLLVAFSNKLKGMSKSQLLKNVSNVLGYITTDFSKSEILSYAASSAKYLSYETRQYIIPHKPTSLVLRGGYEVLILDWASEVKYLKQVLYG